jgi:hypothetical protein
MSISISSHQQIRHRAYEIFLERRNTGREGNAVSDWLEAEQEICTRHIDVVARMRDFAELSLKLSGFIRHSPHLARIRNPIRQPA